MKKIKKPSRVIDPGIQPEMFSDLPPAGVKKTKFTKGFVSPDPELIVIGNRPLRDFLTDAGLFLPLQIREMLQGIDYSGFESKYNMNGRAPYHPAAIMGLILYGITKNQGSLRQLEILARADLGAHWITGGMMPDHATIGRFMQIHADSITTEFFEELTRGLLKKVGQPTTEWSVDGTVIESAANRFRTLKLEVAREVMAEFDAKESSIEPPDDDSPPSPPPVNTPKMSRGTRVTLKPDNLERAIETGETLTENRRKSGGNTKNVQVCTTDPDAVVLLTKMGTYRPGYVASFATSSSRMILGIALHSFSEIKPLDELFSQAQRVAGTPENLLMDTGYHIVLVAKSALILGAQVICPPKRSTLEKIDENQIFSKHLDFEFLPEKNAYLCPAGEMLDIRNPWNDIRRGTSGTTYRTKPSTCGACELQSQCTSSYRKISRSMDEELLDNLRETYARPECKALYSKRLGAVEPVIGALKSNQGLTRFRRFGKRGSTLELVLHACAHNIKRAAALVLFWLVQRVVEAIVEVWRESVGFVQRSLQDGHRLAI